ncbi:MAG: HipA N-terminal domain-containing protein, partial [Pseudomonas sp.]|nr:HipA N-terminal domain-containing protein [Pseudomonas sp.]
MMHELHVYFHSQRVGTLSLVGGRLSFQYAVEALNNPSLWPLSQSLPLQREPFSDRQSRPFFAGLLPEGRMRNLVARQAQVSSQNEFGLLEFIGGECAGAVSISTGDQPPPSDNAYDVKWLTSEQLAAVIDELPKRPMLAGT